MVCGIPARASSAAERKAVKCLGEGGRKDMGSPPEPMKPERGARAVPKTVDTDW
jgi:hypothetical protein